jgi:hypothetical protein
VTEDRATGGARRETPHGPHLVVEETCEAHEGGVVVAPLLPTQPDRRVRVRYEAPDGSGGIVGGHIRASAGRVWAPGHPFPPHKSALVIEASASTVPSGSRVWILELEE